MVQKELKEYIKKEILPRYKKNDWSHQKWHINNVIAQSMKLGKTLDVNLDMVYTIAAFHDIACPEKGAEKMLKKDLELKRFFTSEQIDIMAKAIAGHALQKEPKSIYGRILSTANHFTSVKEYMRSIECHLLEYFPDMTLEERFLNCYNELKKIEKCQVYIPNKDHDYFLKEREYYLNHPFELKKKFYEVDAFLRRVYHLKSIPYPPLKRYYSIDEFYKQKFQCKIMKVSLNAGFSCPNKRNGEGCIYCKNESGDFAGNKDDEIITQFLKVQKKMTKKWPNGKYIAYFQAGTNTFAPLSVLKEKYESVLHLPDVVGLSIATRSDSISKECLDYLETLNQRTFLTIELGLQSSKEETLKFIRRGHSLQNFEKMVKELNKRKINVVIHIINGLPYETKEDMLNTITYLNTLPIQGIKIHMLQILKDTPLAKFYKQKPFPLLTEKEYINIVCNQLERLNPNIIVHRLTGDPKKEELIAPNWLLKKFVILNHIDAELKKRDSYEGKLVR